MKTGLESLDVGAPDITYSGNEGPKSPQEDQQKMAEFQLQEYMEEFERVFPDMKDQRGTPDYMKELQDYFEGLASKQSEGVGSMMAGGENDMPMDMGEPKMEMPEEMREMAAGGGLMDLQKNAPEGEFLAYINPNEAAMLKDAGGSGKLVNGIPSFRPQDMGNAANQAASAAMGGGTTGGNNGNNQPTYSPSPRGPAEYGISSKSPDAPPSKFDLDPPPTSV